MRGYAVGHRGTPEERFWRKVNKSGPVASPAIGPCWVWTAFTNPKGYGKFTRSQQQLAHRMSWVFHFGAIPETTCVLHRCDNPPCIRPDHLFLGTNQDNADDKMSKGRQSRARGENSGMAKLDEIEVGWIKRIHATGLLSYLAIGKMFGVDHTTIRKIVSGKSWKHI